MPVPTGLLRILVVQVGMAGSTVKLAPCASRTAALESSPVHLVVGTDDCVDSGITLISVIGELTDLILQLKAKCTIVGLTKDVIILDSIHNPIWAEDDPEMMPDESTCGARSLAAIAVGLKHGKDAFLSV